MKYLRSNINSGWISTSARAGKRCGLITMEGTSMSTPLVAGAATLVREYFVNGYYPSGLKIPP